MIRLFNVGLVLFLITRAFSQAQGDKMIYRELLENPQSEYYHVPVGLCEDYPEETTDMFVIKKDLEFLKKYDVKFLRISFGWDAIEYEKDKYNWLFWDDFIKTAVEEYNITLIPYICYTPNWNSTAKDDMNSFWNHTPLDYDEFGEFMFDLVSRYKKWIKSWELWNEPDISAFWSGNAADLAKLTKAGSKAVKKADPEAIVVLAGLAHKVPFTRELFRDHGISPFVDVVNMHNYFETWHPSPMEAITDYVNEMHEIVKEYGDSQPLWMAEVGYSTWRMSEAQVSNDYTAYYDYEHTPAYQAIDLFKRCALVASTGQISAIAWYELKDLPGAEDVIGDNNNRNLGVAYLDHNPKPAARALQFFNELFSVKFQSLKKGLQIERQDNSDSHVLAFNNKDNEAIIIAWLQTTNYDKRGDDKSGKLKDNRQETLKIILPAVFKGKATRFDELGNATDFSDVSNKDRTTVINALKLEGGKLAIIKISNS